MPHRSRIIIAIFKPIDRVRPRATACEQVLSFCEMRTDQFSPVQNAPRACPVISKNLKKSQKMGWGGMTPVVKKSGQCDFSKFVKTKNDA